MTRDTILKSPLDPNYTYHREAENRHRETREWLKQREREVSRVKDPAPDLPDRN